MKHNKNKYKSDKKYNCPFCNKKDTRVNLVYHVDKEHNDMIPNDSTPAREVFNSINKRENGSCMICKKETKWNEDRWKYEAFCCDKCYNEYVKIAKERMVKKYNKEHLLNDEEQQKKMLSNRRISGSYKFKDGGIRTYCGSYERKTLEFYDKVLNVHSRDIMTPGVTIEYDDNGTKRFWITDIYYIPYNLVHDVKDGGDNPNTRDMPEYRAKQEMKESAIIKSNEYNYIRLTNNNFEQLLSILAEIKENLLNEIDDKIIRINESVTASVLPNKNSTDVYIVPYILNNIFIGNAITTSKTLEDLYFIEDGRIIKGNALNLDGYTYTLYKYKDKININDIINDSIETYDKDYFYKAITKKNVYCENQIAYDDDFEEVVDSYNEALLVQSILENTIDNIRNDKIILTKISDIVYRDSISKDYKYIDIFNDYNGYYAYNTRTEYRSKYYNTIEEIDDITFKVLNEFGY